MKRIFAAFLFAVMLLGICSCSDTSKPPQPTENVISACGKSITVSEFSYFYYTLFSAEFKGMLSYYGVDENSDWKNEKCPFGEQTWLEYFCSLTANYVVDTLILCTKGENEGIKPGDTNINIINMTLEQDRQNAKEKSMTLDEYYACTYGQGFNSKTLDKLIRYICIADNYKTLKKKEARKQTDLDAYYKAYKNDCDLFTYARIPFTYLEYGDSARFLCESFYSSSLDLPLSKLIEGSETEYCKRCENRNIVFPEDARNWLIDPQRVSGDRKIFQDGKDWFILIFESREKSRRPYLDLHLLSTVKQTGNKFLTAFEDTKKDEDAFVTLAKGFDGFKSYKDAFTFDFDFGADFNALVFDGAEKDKFIRYDTDEGVCFVYISSVGEVYWEESAKKLTESRIYDEYIKSLRESEKSEVADVKVLASVIGQ